MGSELTATPTRLGYFEDMCLLRSSASFLTTLVEDDRLAVLVDCTILYPQGGGQPADQGWITDLEEEVKFRVEDVRLKNGLVYHYGFFEGEGFNFHCGQEVLLKVDKERRELNARLHSAGHLLDICMVNVGLSSLEATKGYHFPDKPYVEYKGVVPKDVLESKRSALEVEANRLIASGAIVKAVITSYEEAASLCGGKLPDYISKESHPRILMLGENLGCPCGGTHVRDILLIGPMKVLEIRVKKGLTKVFYSLSS